MNHCGKLQAGIEGCLMGDDWIENETVRKLIGEMFEISRN